MNAFKNGSVARKQQARSHAAAEAQPLFEALEHRQMMSVTPTTTPAVEPFPDNTTYIKAPAPITAAPADRYLIEPRI